MAGWLLAGLPPDVLMGQALAVGFVLALACVFLAGVKRRAARRLVAGKQKTKPTRDPTIVLGFLALILGPALGAHLAVLHNWFFEVNSLDHLYNVWLFHDHRQDSQGSCCRAHAPSRRSRAKRTQSGNRTRRIATANLTMSLPDSPRLIRFQRPSFCTIVESRAHLHRIRQRKSLRRKNPMS